MFAHILLDFSRIDFKIVKVWKKLRNLMISLLGTLQLSWLPEGWSVSNNTNYLRGVLDLILLITWGVFWIWYYWLPKGWSGYDITDYLRGGLDLILLITWGMVWIWYYWLPVWWSGSNNTDYLRGGLDLIKSRMTSRASFFSFSFNSTWFNLYRLALYNQI